MMPLEDIAFAFCIFHDGVIEGWTGNANILTLKIGTYLAKCIDKSFDSFYVDLIHIEKIELDPWIDSDPSSTLLVTELEKIFEAEWEIMRGDVEGDNVLVTCLQSDKKFNYSGGNLFIKCQEVKIFDQNRNELTLAEIHNICKGYWTDWTERNKRERESRP